MPNKKSVARPLWGGDKTRKEELFWLDKNEITTKECLDFNNSILQSLKPKDFSVYPDLGEVYLLLTKLFYINEQNTILVNGADGGIREVFLSFSKDKSVIILNPTFAMISVYPQNLFRDLVQIKYNLNEQKISFCFDDLLKNIRNSKKPPLVILASPDSPTGSLLSIKDFQTINNEIERKEGLLLFDATYGMYAGYDYFLETISIAKNSKSVLLTASLSKAPGLAGARLGLLIGPETLISKIRSIRPMYEMGSIQSQILLFVLENWDKCLGIIDQILNNKKDLENILKNESSSVLETYGNFTLFKSTSKIERVLNRLCYYRDTFNSECLKGYSRLSTPPSEFNLELRKGLKL